MLSPPADESEFERRQRLADEAASAKFAAAREAAIAARALFEPLPDETSFERRRREEAEREFARKYALKNESFETKISRSMGSFAGGFSAVALFIFWVPATVLAFYFLGAAVGTIFLLVGLLLALRVISLAEALLILLVAVLFQSRPRKGRY